MTTRPKSNPSDLEEIQDLRTALIQAEKQIERWKARALVNDANDVWRYKPSKSKTRNTGQIVFNICAGSGIFATLLISLAAHF